MLPCVMGMIGWCHTLVFSLSILCSCGASVLESVYWNSSNTKFIPGQGLVLHPQMGDKMDIVCPRASPSSGQKEEFYRVYLVSRSQMQSCAVDKAESPLLNCDKPHRDVKFTLKFQEYSPNLWGLEFLKGRDYYITSTSTGLSQGMDNAVGGVCRTKSMKLVLRVGQNPGDPPSPPQESPTRFPPKQPKSGNEAPVVPEDDGKGNGGSGELGGKFIWALSGCSTLALAVTVLLVLLWRNRRRRCMPEGRQSASVSLDTLATAKRDSVSSENNDSDRSEIVFPLRPSESMLCRHYERVSGDYGQPVYIVQEIPSQSTTNIYYKV